MTVVKTRDEAGDAFVRNGRGSVIREIVERFGLRRGPIDRVGVHGVLFDDRNPSRTTS
jgi:hypothetical protein